MLITSSNVYNNTKTGKNDTLSSMKVKTKRDKKK